eukprot:gnl/Chilomastix_cuspidata/5679.p1 GENE.gnl/Chilomastix_cuspidata/5679~~gnl/Chilomastix_cuspidata/5679.p1  ORF type:complete len:410 (+),score=14.07 gnl/Chilomastix_cuspidata/5679:1001-2230(+)
MHELDRPIAAAARSAEAIHAQETISTLRRRSPSAEPVRRASPLPRDSPQRQFVHNTLQEFCGRARRIDDFKAFPDDGAVRREGGVPIAAMKEQRSFFNAPSRSSPHRRDSVQRESHDLSLSPSGVLCSGAFASKSLLMRSLRSGQAAVFNGSYNMLGRELEGELFVSTGGQASAHHTPTAGTLAGCILEAFEETLLAGVYAWARCLDRASHGQTAFIDDHDFASVISMNLRGRTSRRIRFDGEFESLGGATGLRVPGAAWAANGRTATFALAEGHRRVWPGSHCASPPRSSPPRQIRPTSRAQSCWTNVRTLCSAVRARSSRVHECSRAPGTCALVPRRVPLSRRHRAPMGPRSTRCGCPRGSPDAGRVLRLAASTRGRFFGTLDCSNAAPSAVSITRSPKSATAHAQH